MRLVDCNGPGLVKTYLVLYILTKLLLKYLIYICKHFFLSLRFNCV